MKSKGQMEILGLAMVVIILLVASVFAVRFIVLKEPSDYRKGFLTSELASNMLNTFLKTTSSSCRKLSMSELIRDCSQGGTISCENNQNSCQYAESAAISIFSETFDKWKTGYELSAYTENNPSFLKLGKRCTGEKKSKIFLIPSTVTVSVRLDIC